MIQCVITSYSIHYTKLYDAVFTSCNPDEVEPTLQFLADGDKYATGDVTVFVGETVTYSWTATGDSKLASFTVRHENLDLTVEDGNVFVIDGKTATGTLTRTFDKVGEYKFLFQVTDKDDLTASQTVTVTVVDPTPVTNRITSYNVCYTKLLRANQAFAFFGSMEISIKSPIFFPSGTKVLNITS